MTLDIPDAAGAADLVRLREEVYVLTRSHLASLGVFAAPFHPGDARDPDWLDPRPLEELRTPTVVVSPMGFSRTIEDPLRALPSRQPTRPVRATTMTTLAALESVLANPDVDFGRLVVEELAVTLLARWATGRVGPSGLAPDNPLTVAHLLSTVVTLQRVVELRAGLGDLPPAGSGRDQEVERLRLEGFEALQDGPPVDGDAGRDPCALWREHEAVARIVRTAREGSAAHVIVVIGDLRRAEGAARDAAGMRLGRALGRLQRLLREELAAGTAATSEVDDDLQARVTQLADTIAAQGHGDGEEVLETYVSQEALEAYEDQVSALLGEVDPASGSAVRIRSGWEAGLLLQGHLWATLAASFREGLVMRPAGPDARRLAPHPYVIHRCLATLDDLEELPNFFRFVSQHRIDRTPWVSRSADRLTRQLAFLAAGDKRKDPFELGYDLVIQLRHAPSTLGTAVLRRALEALVDMQHDDGQWLAKHRAWLTSTGGDAYCFSVELWTALLDVAGASWARGRRSSLGGAMGPLLDAFHGVERSKIALRGPGGAGGAWVWGWDSGQRSGFADEVGPDGSDRQVPEGWATAGTFRFLLSLHGHLDGEINAALLSSYRVRSPRGGADETALARVKGDFRYDGEDIRLRDLGDAMALGLRNRGLSDRPYYSLSERADRTEIPRSMLITGPPGTGKTSFVAAVAARLGLTLLTIAPTDMGLLGLDRVAPQLDHLFGDLAALRDVVVLFDEIDEFAQVRDDAHDAQQRLWTTMLLPYFTNLFDDAQVMFFATANHGQRLDPAFVRPGRFGSSILLLPPSVDSKLEVVEAAAVASDSVLTSEALRQLGRMIQDDRRTRIDITVVPGPDSEAAGAPATDSVAPRDALRWATLFAVEDMIDTVDELVQAGQEPGPAARQALLSLPVTRYDQFASEAEEGDGQSRIDGRLLKALEQVRSVRRGDGDLASGDLTG